MRIWQDTLPLASRLGMTLSPIDQSLRTDMEVGDPKVRRTTFARRDVADVTWRAKDAEMAAFRAWFGDDAYSLTGASDDLSTGWTLSDMTMTDAADVGPDGQLCDRLTPSTATAAHGCSRSLGLLAGGGSVVVRATLKASGWGYARILFVDSDGVNRYASVSLLAGTVGTTSGLTSYSIKSRGNGWWRVELVAPVGSGAAACTVRIQSLSSAFAVSHAGDGINGVAVCEQQARVYTGYDLHLPTDASGNATGAAGGSAWFAMAMPLGGGLTVKQCQFIGTYAAEPLTGLNWQISAKLRVR